MTISPISPLAWQRAAFSAALVCIAAALLGASHVGWLGAAAMFISAALVLYLPAVLLRARRSELIFRKAFSASPEAISIASMEDGTFIDVNEVFCRITGYTRGEVIGRTSIDLDVWVDPGDRKKYVDRLTADGELKNYDMRFRMRSGEIMSFWISSELIDLEGVRCSLNIMLDVTDRKRSEEGVRRMEARLRQSEKMEALGQLAGGIAHDFNNVLGGIIGYTDMSLEHAASNPVLEKNLRNVLKAADRAKLLVKQILVFSRQGETHQSVTSVRPIVKEVLGLLRASIPSSVVIEAELSKGTKPVLADPTKIHEILMNLATNAVHAMDRKGTLTVRLYSESLAGGDVGQIGELTPGDYTVMEIADTGCGMDPVTLSRAFEPFFTTKAEEEGTGLGLSVVRGVVQSSGGDIKVESAVGFGTSVRIYLPASEELATAAPRANAQASLSGTEHILFVDDEEMFIEMNVEWLTALGYHVTAMTDSGAALDYANDHAHRIDILVTDQTMPGLSGLELAAEVMKSRPTLPVVLCSGFSSEISPEAIAASGIERFLMKPYRYHEIGTALREVLDGPPPAA